MDGSQKSLNVKEANALLKNLAQSIILNDELEDDEVLGTDHETELLSPNLASHPLKNCKKPFITSYNL